MKVQTFKAIGGPLNGHNVTEDYAGEDYTRFNNSGGVSYRMTYMLSGTVKILIYVRDKSGKKIIEIPKCVLIHKSCF
jgi:hypothetical protein